MVQMEISSLERLLGRGSGGRFSLWLYLLLVGEQGSLLVFWMIRPLLLPLDAFKQEYVGTDIVVTIRDVDGLDGKRGKFLVDSAVCLSIPHVGTMMVLLPPDTVPTQP